MQIICKYAKLTSNENIDIWYSVLSKTYYVGVPLSSLRGDVEKSTRLRFAAAILKAKQLRPCGLLLMSSAVIKISDVLKSVYLILISGEMF